MEVFQYYYNYFHVIMDTNQELIQHDNDFLPQFSLLQTYLTNFAIESQKVLTDKTF